MTPSTPYRQSLYRAIGRRPPIVGPTLKRGIFSALVAIPISLLAFAIADNTATPDWLRHLICPGWAIGLRLSRGQPCGAFLDCLAQIAQAVGQAVEIIWFVNVIIYGLLIFGVSTTLSALRKT